MEIEKNVSKTICKILVGNKCDMEEERKVSKDIGEEYAFRNGMRFIETSAKDSIKISEAFYIITKDILFELEMKKKQEKIESQGPKGMSLAYCIKKEKKEKNEEEEEEKEEGDNIEKKCSSDKHKDSNANNYCPECKIYMCKICEEFHSKLFNNHHQYKINNNNYNVFTGLCKIKNNSMKLEYFCKTHIKLYCAACLCNIKGNGNGRHKNCEVLKINALKKEKEEMINRIHDIIDSSED